MVLAVRLETDYEYAVTDTGHVLFPMTIAFEHNRLFNYGVHGVAVACTGGCILPRRSARGFGCAGADGLSAPRRSANDGPLFGLADCAVSLVITSCTEAVASTLACCASLNVP